MGEILETGIYLPTWMVDFYGFHVGRSSIDPMGALILGFMNVLPQWTKRNSEQVDQ